MRAAALAMCLIATPAAAQAQQFDLICQSGQTTVRYRIDLDRGEACADKCDRIWKMGPATTGELRVIDRQPAYRGDLEERFVVNRQTGESRYFSSLSGRTSSREGMCTPTPFSGFPAPKF